MRVVLVVVVSAFGPLLLVLLKLNAVGSIDLKYGQGGQAVRDFLEHYIINNI